MSPGFGVARMGPNHAEARYHGGRSVRLPWEQKNIPQADHFNRTEAYNGYVRAARQARMPLLVRSYATFLVGPQDYGVSAEEDQRRTLQHYLGRGLPILGLATDGSGIGRTRSSHGVFMVFNATLLSAVVRNLQTGPKSSFLPQPTLHCSGIPGCPTDKDL